MVESNESGKIVSEDGKCRYDENRSEGIMITESSVYSHVIITK